VSLLVRAIFRLYGKKELEEYDETTAEEDKAHGGDQECCSNLSNP
jgi:hypothetical protein